jgi:PAS domain S-box-containing protein
MSHEPGAPPDGRDQPYEQLREREELYRLLTENSNDLVTLVDLDGRHVYVSPSFQRILGADPGTLFERVHPDDLAETRRAWDDVVAGRACAVTFRYQDADGSWRWLESWGARVQHQGKPHVIGVSRDVTERKRADQERQAHLWFLESMDQVNRAMRRTNDLEQMMHDVLDVVLTVLHCDRAWLLYPCDPSAPAWSVPMQCVRPEASGTCRRPFEATDEPTFRTWVQTVSAADGPVTFGPGSSPIPSELARAFGIQSQIAMAVHTKVGRPYMFGAHHCASPRAWTPQEQRLFQVIGRRLADALTSLLVYRNLRESEARFRTLVEHATDAFYLHDTGGTILDVNSQACDNLGYTRDELIGMSPTSFDVGIDTEALGQISARLDSGEVVAFDTHHRRKDGTAFPVEVRIRPFWEGGRRLAVSLARNTSDRQRAREALTLFRSLVDHANDAIEVVDPHTGRFLDVNDKACRDHGYTRDEYLALTVPEIDPLMTMERWRELKEDVRTAGSRVIESQHRRQNGSTFAVEINLTYIRLDRDYLLAVVRDVSERKHAERALVESHSLLHAVVEGTSDAVFVKDLEGRYLMINTAGARLLGRTVEDVVGRDDWTLFAPDTARAIVDHDRQVMAAGALQMFEERATAAGVTRTYQATKGVYRDAQGQVIGLIGVSRDVTELKRLEEQFRQSQKMEAIGRLAGGIAHDFNNLLTVINGYGDLLSNQIRPGDPSRELLAEILKSAERATHLTRQLLAFSRKQVLQPQVVNLNALLSELRKLMVPLIREDIHLTFVPGSDLDLVKIDPAQFEQAIINLVVNARDAMPDGGRLLIETRNIDLEADDVRHRRDVRPGGYVLVAVTDSGQGIDPSTKTRIFEPFFTTKNPGQGTGLGLAMVYGFVTQSGGHVEVYSEVDHGTTFKVYLPRAEGGTAATASATAALKVPRGTETVLLVEDEDAVRNLSKFVLVSNGYSVLEARHGEEALTVAQQHEGAIQLLITDVVMPGMSGRQLAHTLRQLRPATRVLFMSGYTGESVLHDNVSNANLAFLQKPFSPIGLARKVREVLDAGHP